ncbi:MAG: TlpA family protein disulfide reductase [Planctomycetes bacterium]|nr:TlpA family protein disulfide reductase [Planctomycetota bacterium]
MKTKQLFYLLLVPMFIIGGCKKNKTEPTPQTKNETEVTTTQPVADSTPPKPAGKPAPAFALQDLNGKSVSLADFRGKVVILNFWATWCPPCIREIPDFIELYDQYKDKGFEMMGISLDQAGISVVKSFAQKVKINYPVMMTDGRVDKTYGGITSIPTTFLIDTTGNIIKKYIGFNEKAVFEADIKALLPQAKQ